MQKATYRLRATSELMDISQRQPKTSAAMRKRAVSINKPGLLARTWKRDASNCLSAPQRVQNSGCASNGEQKRHGLKHKQNQRSSQASSEA